MTNAYIEISDSVELVVDPLVSVIVLAYNHSKYLAEAIESVLCQEANFKYEILIGEDCSADTTREIAVRYQDANRSRIRIVTADLNVGMNENIARLLDASRGCYIAICEGDDYWTARDKLARQVQFLESRNDASLVFSDRLIRKGDVLSVAAYESRDYSTADILEGFIPPTQTMMWRRSCELASHIRTYADNPSGDRLIALHCSLSGSISHMSFLSAVYRISGEGVWSSISARKHRRLKYLRLKEFHRRMGIDSPASINRCAECLLLDSFHDLSRANDLIGSLADVVYFSRVIGLRRAITSVIMKVRARLGL